MPSVDLFATLEGSTLTAAAARISFICGGLLSADDHEIVARFVATVRLPDDATDRKMFVEQVLSGRSLITRDEIRDRLTPPIRSAIEPTARASTAEMFVQSGRPTAEPIAVAAIQRAAFAIGLEVVGPFELSIESPTLRQSQTADAARTRAAAATSARVEHVRRTSETITAFQALQRDNPSTAAAALLTRFDAVDAEAIWAASLIESARSQPPAVAYAVAGAWTESSGLYAIQSTLTDQDVSAARDLMVAISPGAKQIAPPPRVAELGPLRSVTPAVVRDERVLLIGGRHGIGVFSPAQPSEIKLLLDREINSVLGFSRAIVVGDSIFACHGEAGIVQWRLDGDGGEPTLVIRPDAMPHATDAPARPKHLARLGDDALFAIGSQLIRLHDGELILLGEPFESPIVGVVEHDGGAIVVSETGSLRTIDFDGRVNAVRSAGRPTTAAALIRSPLGDRLLLSEAGSGIETVAPDGTGSRRTASRVAIRDLEAAGDLVVGLADDRQRVAVWRPWEPERVAELNLASIARTRVGGIAAVM